MPWQSRFLLIWNEGFLWYLYQWTQFESLKVISWFQKWKDEVLDSDIVFDWHEFKSNGISWKWRGRDEITDTWIVKDNWWEDKPDK